MKISIIVFCSVVFISCARNVEEDLVIPPPTIPEEITYSNNIAPLLNTYCVSCHSGLTPSAGVGLETYDQVASWVTPNTPQNSTLYKVISHTKEPFMPQGQAKLSDIDIQAVETWILNGAQND